MTAFFLGIFGLTGAVLLAAIGELVSDEIRYWLDRVPHAILRLAAAQLDPAQRETIYQDEWLPELTYALRGKESRPITRLIIGTRYAIGLLIAARRIARSVNRALPADAPSPPPRPVGYLVSATHRGGQPITIQGRYKVSNGDTFTLISSTAEIGVRILTEAGFPRWAISVTEDGALPTPPATAK